MHKADKLPIFTGDVNDFTEHFLVYCELLLLMSANKQDAAKRTIQFLAKHGMLVNKSAAGRGFSPFRDEQKQP